MYPKRLSVEMPSIELSTTQKIHPGNGGNCGSFCAEAGFPKGKGFEAGLNRSINFCRGEIPFRPDEDCYARLDTSTTNHRRNVPSTARYLHSNCIRTGT